MKLKIGLMIIFIVLSINNVYCETDIYSIEYSFDNTKTISVGSYDSPQSFYGIRISDVNTITDVTFFGCYVPETVWGGGTQNSNFSFADLYSDSGKTNYIGRGIIGYIKDGTSGYRVQLHVLSLDWGVLTGAQKIFWATDNPLDGMSFKYHTSVPTENGNGIWAARPALDRAAGNGCIHTAKIKYNFYNPIEYFYNSTYKFFELTIFRNSTYPSKWYVNDSNILWENETSLQTNNESVYSFDLDNCTWDTHIITNNDDIINLDIDFCSLMDEPDLTQPTLTTDKTYYNTSETITINLTNIQKIYDDCSGLGYDFNCLHPYDIYFLYDVIDDYNQFGTKGSYAIPYYYAENGSGIIYEDDSYTLDTSFLAPETKYRMGLVGHNGYYGREDEILLFSDYFYVYPDNEYITTSCTKIGNCYTYVGTPISIFYKIDNNSNIIIKDNDGNIINTIYNIIGTGTKIYNIPDDSQHLNTYPNWKIYLNNSDYATSYNTEIEIYWSSFVTSSPTSTPYPTSTPDINISDQLDNLTVEIQPIKDLLFGFVYIVIDNPDYDNDNIIDENEINHWFNSLIPMCLFLLLIILYIGLKKNRK